MDRSPPPELRDLIADVDRTHRRLGERSGTRWDRHVLSDPMAAYDALMTLPHREGMFLEWGSGLGVVSLIAARLGFDAHGIEIEPHLVDEANALASRHGLRATFVHGDFIPADHDPDPEVLDETLFHEASGPDGYAELGLDPADFDVIYGFPWPGDEAFLIDLFEAVARDGAILVANLSSDGMLVRSKGEGSAGRR